MQLVNSASFEFTNDASGVADDLTQAAVVAQSNVVTNTIAVAYTGSVKAADVGISAEILNGFMSLANTTNGAISGAANVSGDVIQTATITQTNRVESKIAVNNSGSIWGANSVSSPRSARPLCRLPIPFPPPEVRLRSPNRLSLRAA